MNLFLLETEANRYRSRNMFLYRSRYSDTATTHYIKSPEGREYYTILKIRRKIR